MAAAESYLARITLQTNVYNYLYLQVFLNTYAIVCFIYLITYNLVSENGSM